jgi:hypothetical protein
MQVATTKDALQIDTAPALFLSVCLVSIGLSENREWLINFPMLGQTGNAAFHQLPLPHIPLL